MLAGLIRDNGIDSPANRGTFYGCRNSAGELEGVALIGHATLIEAHTDRALRAFADQARQCSKAHMIMAEKNSVEEFWTHYFDDGRRMKRECREFLLELNQPIPARSTVKGLRLATLEDIDRLLPVHAQMAFEESGVNPLVRDPEGFRERYARRIRQGRTWVWIKSGQLLFKTELVSLTPEVAYLEGVWVAPEKRSSGCGARCLAHVVKALMASIPSVCVFVNQNNPAARKFYERVGFKAKAVYDTVFLNTPAPQQLAAKNELTDQPFLRETTPTVSRDSPKL
jgi:ribosomal protein S18 acetylase RimI-like enzyme